MKKKKTNAGISQRSNQDSQCSFTMNEVRSVRLVSASATSDREVVGRVLDIGVGEQEIVGIEFERLRDALMLCPDFSGPARGERLSIQDGESGGHVGGLGCVAGDCGGRVGTGVVGEDDVEVGVDLLMKEAGNGASDDISLVASGDDDGDGRASGDGDRRMWL